MATTHPPPAPDPAAHARASAAVAEFPIDLVLNAVLSYVQQHPELLEQVIQRLLDLAVSKLIDAIDAHLAAPKATA